MHAGGGGIIHPADGGDLTTLSAYKLQFTSLLIGAGLDLTKINGIDVGNRDYYNTPLFNRPSYSVGAHEFQLSFDNETLIVLPIDFTDFKASFKSNQLQLSWRIETDEDIQSFVVETSADGR